MKCPKCQSELPEKAKFCMDCGANISASSKHSGVGLGVCGVAVAGVLLVVGMVWLGLGQWQLHERIKDKLRPVAGVDWTSPATGMEFVWVEALKSWVGKYEVTNGEYRKYKPDHDSKSYEGITLNNDRQPVVEVNFDDAKKFAEWLDERERAAGEMPGGYRVRLPSEKEWETFAQCGDGRTYPWGNDMPPKYGNYHGQEGAGVWTKISNYRDRYPGTCPVEDSGKNDWGLYGVGGNVWECCASDSTGAAFGAWHGASWLNYYPDILRCSCRLDFAGSFRNYLGIGLRLVLAR